MSGAGAGERGRAAGGARPSTRTKPTVTTHGTAFSAEQHDHREDEHCCSKPVHSDAPLLPEHRQLLA